MLECLFARLSSPLLRGSRTGSSQNFRRVRGGGVFRAGVQLGHRLVHAAVLRAQHPLPMFAVKVFGDVVRPVRKSLSHPEGLLVAAEGLGIKEAGEDLVVDVPGRPHAVQVEAAALQPARRDVSPNGVEPLGVEALVESEGGKEAVGPGLLALREIFDEGVHLRLIARVAGVGVLLGAGGEIVSQRVARKAAGLPAAVDLALRRESAVRSEAPRGGDRDRG